MVRGPYGLLGVKDTKTRRQMQAQNQKNINM